MRTILTYLFFTIALSCFGQSIEKPSYQGIKPVWDHLFIDEFNGEAIDDCPSSEAPLDKNPFDAGPCTPDCEL